MFGYKKRSKIHSNKIFRTVTLILWVVSFAIFHSWTFCPGKKSWKAQNTVSSYKKGSKIQSDKIFWSATSRLRVVSFHIFDSWPFYQVKSWKKQNTVLVTKRGQKLNPTRFSDSWPQIVCNFIGTFVSKSFFTNGWSVWISFLGCNVFFCKISCGKGVKWKITVLGYKKRSKCVWETFLNSRSKVNGDLILHFCFKYQSHLSIGCNSFDAVFKRKRLVCLSKTEAHRRLCASPSLT